MRQFDVVIERDSAGNYVGSIPALRGCHTQARSLDELMARMREAAELCLEVEGQETEDLEFVGVDLPPLGLGIARRPGGRRPGNQ